MVYLYEACDQKSDFCHQQLLRKMRRKISWMDGRTDRGKTVYPPPPSKKSANQKQESPVATMFVNGQTSRNLLRSCQSFGLTDMKILPVRKKSPKKFTVTCIMFSLALLECFTLVLAIGHLISPLVFIEV